jgi:two-component system, cell cycle response regulator CpdR
MPAILLVDDDPDVLNTHASILIDAGHDVTTAPNGWAALDMLDTRRPFDLLVTDVIMPVLNGLNLARMALLRRPAMKVLFLSGQDEHALASLDPGKRPGKLLQKPVPLADLQREVGAALEMSAMASTDADGCRHPGEARDARCVHGQVSLLLCESLLHLLIEEGLITRGRALDAVETVAEVTREMAEMDPASNSVAAGLADAIARSLAARHRP